MLRPPYNILHQIIETNGQPVESRYGPCLELQNQQIFFEPGTIVTRPGFNLQLAFMEMVQIMAGRFDLDAIKRVAPKAKHELFTAEGAYGPRIWYQMERIVRYLTEDPNGRQAIAFVGSGADSCTNKLPCTISMQFLRRDKVLNMYVTMRSWDATMGLPVDIVCFGGLLLAVAHVLQVEPGMVCVTAGSLHMYTDYPARWRLGSDDHASFALGPHFPGSWSAVERWAVGEIETEWPTKRPYQIDLKQGVV